MAHWSKPCGTETIQRSSYNFPGGVSHTTVVQLGDNRFLVYSPGLGLADDSPVPLGGQGILVAPSVAHTLGIQEWSTRFPSFELVANSSESSAIPGFEGKISSVQSLMAPSWVTYHSPPGNCLGELWLRLELDNSVVWLICDALTNLRQLAPSWLKRTLQRLYGLRLGPAVGAGFRRSLSEPGEFFEWASVQLADAHMIIPCHGEPIQAGEIEVVLKLLNANA